MWQIPSQTCLSLLTFFLITDSICADLGINFVSGLTVRKEISKSCFHHCIPFVHFEGCVGFDGVKLHNATAR